MRQWALPQTWTWPLLEVWKRLQGPGDNYRLPSHYILKHAYTKFLMQILLDILRGTYHGNGVGIYQGLRTQYGEVSYVDGQVADGHQWNSDHDSPR